MQYAAKIKHVPKYPTLRSAWQSWRQSSRYEIRAHQLYIFTILLYFEEGPLLVYSNCAVYIGGMSSSHDNKEGYMWKQRYFAIISNPHSIDLEIFWRKLNFIQIFKKVLWDAYNFHCTLQWVCVFEYLDRILHWSFN